MGNWTLVDVLPTIAQAPGPVTAGRSRQLAANAAAYSPHASPSRRVKPPSACQSTSVGTHAARRGRRWGVKWPPGTPYLLELQALLARLERTQLDHGPASREHLHRVMLLLIDRPWRRR